MIRFTSLIILLLCSSCIQLGGEPQPTRFYLLEAVTESSLAQQSKPIQLELSPIAFPSYLDRPQIVSRTAENAILIADHDRWAEPLPDNLTRTLQENLFQQLPAIRISSAPWAPRSGPTFVVKLMINRFDGVIGQQTDVDIRWSLISGDNNTELHREHYRAQLPVGDGYQNFISGLNSALAGLSQNIAIALLAIQK